MQALVDFFANFGDVLTNAIDFFVGRIVDTVRMVWLLGVSATKIPQLLSFLPSPIVTLLSLFMTAAICYKVLGREG